MLVLTRKLNEKIVINKNIILTLLEIKGESTVKLGIEAPKSVPIVREELLSGGSSNQSDDPKGD